MALLVVGSSAFLLFTVISSSLVSAASALPLAGTVVVSLTMLILGVAHWMANDGGKHRQKAVVGIHL